MSSEELKKAKKAKRTRDEAKGEASPAKKLKKEKKKDKKLKKEKKKDKKSKKEKKEKKEKKGTTAPGGNGAGAAAAAPAAPGAGVSGGDLAAWRKEANVTVSGDGVENFPPALTFADASFPAELSVLFRGFEKPTPIQSEVWPKLSAGRDVIGISETGSGKTLAFSLPGLVRLRSSASSGSAPRSSEPSPRMLILSPTRELAMQCVDVLDKASGPAGVGVVCTYGGAPKHEQKRLLRSASRQQNGLVVVATPGRLLDLESEGAINLGSVEYLVLDEADRMLDMGFERDVRSIISSCLPAPQRQTVMFSATWPEEIRALAGTFLADPLKVTVGNDELTSNRRVSQTVEVIDERARDQRLRELLRTHHKNNNRVLVFALYKKEAARLERYLQRDFRVNSVHGDKAQAERTRAVDEFRSNRCPLLVATDVAARGLDIPDVEVVINYSFPLTCAEYIHRIGRTGRAGKTGKSITFFHDGDKRHAGELANILRDANQQVPPELLKFGAGVKRKEHKLYGAFAGRSDLPMKKATKITFD